MKGWFQRSGLEHTLNNKSACGRKRHFTRRAAELAHKQTLKTKNKRYPYPCSLCGWWHLTSMEMSPKT